MKYDLGGLLPPQSSSALNIIRATKYVYVKFVAVFSSLRKTAVLENSELNFLNFVLKRALVDPLPPPPLPTSRLVDLDCS